MREWDVVSRVLFPSAAEREEAKKRSAPSMGAGGNVRPTLKLKPQLHEAAPQWKDSADKNTSFYVRASQYRGLLHFVACRVLGNSDRADTAVENCLHSASRHATAFDSEGAFRSWLVRIAIDEALVILHERSIPKNRRKLGDAVVKTALL